MNSMTDMNYAATLEAQSSATQVIALHCSGSGAAQWRKLGQALGTRHAFVAPEHYGCDPHSRNVFENTRTIRSNRFMTWLTNGNNFHVEHHFRPGVPVEKLRQLHGEIAQNVMHGNDGYAQFYAGVLGDLLLSRAAQTRALTINPLRPESQP